jgi:hypothetical protein
MENTQEKTIESLPDEILLKIFEVLDCESLKYAITMNQR